MQPCTPFPILNHFIVPCMVLTIASCPAYRFLRRQVSWYDVPIYLRIFPFVVIHTVKSFSIVNVVVHARVGKEFPDMRQNEREIKFIRMGNAVRTMGQFKGDPTLNRGP